MYIFGYGSLLWKQGFEFEEMIKGYVKGFKRRFWHGSEDHRGTPEYPGRVVSISHSEDPDEKVWGVTFRICPSKAAAVRENLVARETGYDIVKTVFYPTNKDLKPFELELFMTNPESRSHVGPAPIKEIAWQIYHAKGMCGPNVEYLMKLIWYNRKNFPHHSDDHLNELEQEIHHIAKQKGDPVELFMLHEF